MINVPLHHRKTRFVLGEFGSTVSHLLLEGCLMDIHHLTSFLCPFTNLKDLSLLNPHILFDPKPEYPLKPPGTKGKINLELQIDMAHGGRPFVYELSLLPMVVRNITLLERYPPISVPWNYGVNPRTTEINKLLAASRETLTHFRVHAGELSSQSWP